MFREKKEMVLNEKSSYKILSCYYLRRAWESRPNLQNKAIFNKILWDIFKVKISKRLIIDNDQGKGRRQHSNDKYWEYSFSKENQ